MKSPYLYPWIKEPFYRRVIRWLYVRFLDELYIPLGTEVSTTYGGGTRRGIKVFYPKRGKWRGTQESYLKMPDDIFKKELEGKK